MYDATRCSSSRKIFEGRDEDVTEENIQARCRGMLLMSISNKTGRMLLTTGNKSEMAVGYATLYGDMAGGFAPIKDCSKSLVYRLARVPEYARRSHSGACDYAASLRQNFRPDQKDTDSLPEYDVLDPILAGLYREETCRSMRSSIRVSTATSSYAYSKW